MTPDSPIACSLSADELPKRLAAMTAVGKGALLGVRPDGVLRFRDDDETRERLEAILAAESECCSFLRFHLAPERGELALSISAPPGAEPVASDLAAAFAAGREAA